MRTLRRILIVQPYGIGDLLFITPVLRALRLIPTVEVVDLLLGSRTAEVVQANPHINEIFVIDKDRYHRQSWKENWRDQFALGQRLRRKHYDLMLDYSLRGENAFWGEFFLGIPDRAGFDYKNRGFFHNIKLEIPEGFLGRHVVDFCCDLAEKAGVLVEDRFLEYYFDPQEKNIAQKKLQGTLAKIPQKYAVISPGGGESWGKDASRKRWPVHSFAELVEKMAELLGFQGIVIVGSTGEKELAEELRSRVSVPAVNLAGELSLAESALVIQKAALFIGNDGGLVHLANSLHVPVIAFYGPVDPVVYGPYPASPKTCAIYHKELDCRPCYYKFRYDHTCKTLACLHELTVEDAMGILEEDFLDQFAK